MEAEVNDLGFIVEEDQSDREMPAAEGWQSQYNKTLRRAWLQGHSAGGTVEGMEVNDNPYVGRGDSLEVMTSALGWEDGFLAAKAGQTVEDCPYPEG